MEFADDVICFLWIQLGGPRDGAGGKFFGIKISLLYIPIGFPRDVPQVWEQLWGSPLSWEHPLMLVPGQNPTLISRFSPQGLKLSPGASEQFDSGNSSFSGAS